MTPLELLRSGLGERTEREALRHALSTPCGWPADPALAERAIVLGCAPPSAWGPGQVVLASYGMDQSTAAWVSLTRGTQRDGSAYIVGSAADSSALAFRVARRDAPLLTRVSGDGPPTIQAVLVSKQGGHVRMLEGGSFGLAFVAAHLSNALGVPTTPNVCASVEIRADGSAHGVSGLAAKIEHIATHVLGVTRFVVARSQELEAKKIAGDLAARFGRALHIEGVSSVAEALGRPLFFPRPIAELLLDQWRDPADASEAVADVFDLATRGSNLLLGWSGVERASAELAAREDLSAGDRHRAEIARRIARRHTGVPDAEIPFDEPWLPALRGAIRPRVMAHVVQSHTDSCSSRWEEVVALATTPHFMTERGDEFEDHLKLAGALGRAYASWGRFDEALVWLVRAIEGWRTHRLADQASHALSESFRVASLTRVDEALLRTLDDARRLFEASPDTAPISRGYVDEARARMLLSMEDAQGAYDLLHRPPDTLPSHLGARWRRTLARAAFRLGQPDVASATRAALPENDPVPVLLAGLDAALEQDAPTDETLDALRALPRARPYLERVLAYARGVPAAKAVALHYPY